MFKVDSDPNKLGNGDLAIISEKGRLVALVYAMSGAVKTKEYATVIAHSLNSAFLPSMSDMMVDPELLDSFLERNPLPKEEHNDLLAAAKDALYGWQYIRQNHGDLYGVGWDRVEEGLAKAIAKSELSK